MDRGTWQATVYGVAKSQTWLSNFPFFLRVYDSSLFTPPPPPKAAGLELGPEQEETLQQGQDAVQTALLLGPHKSADGMGLEVAGEDAVWSLWQPLYVNHRTNR